MKIPDPLRLWWYDGAGVRVHHYSRRQWVTLATVSFLITAAALLPIDSGLGQATLVVVPYLLVPAGLAATGFASTANILTSRFRRTQRSELG